MQPVPGAHHGEALTPRVVPQVLLVGLLPAAIYAPTALVESASTQDVAVQQVDAATDDEKAAVDESDVLLALDRGWFDAARGLLRIMRARGDAVSALAGVKARATKIRDEATDVINLMRVGANAEATVRTRNGRRAHDLCWHSC